MSSARLPTAFLASAAFHGGALGLLMYAAQVSRKSAPRVISNVDLLIQVKKPLQAPTEPAPAKPKQSTFDFLKLALPSVPKAAAPRMVDVKLPELRKPIMPEIPDKIVERARKQDAPKLDGLDLGRRDADMARIEAKIPARRAAALAEAPKLEEVGRRQVKDLPAALALEESRREAVALKALQPVLVADKRRETTMSPALQEAAPAPRAERGLSSKLAGLLPQAPLPEMRPQDVRALPSVLKKAALDQKAPARKAATMIESEKKKGVELEGPIADRKVMAYEVPGFPAWAREQGVIEASVAIRFWVSREGDVLANMRVERTSGYGRLDRHAMESLKKWKFAPVPVDEKQWGVITFKFILE